MVSRHQRAQVTYEELDQRSNTLARGLLNVGVAKGDRVAVSLGNNIEYAIVSGDYFLDEWEIGNENGADTCQATYALFKLGAILVSKGHFVNSMPPAPKEKRIRTRAIY